MRELKNKGALCSSMWPISPPNLHKPVVIPHYQNEINNHNTLNENKDNVDVIKFGDVDYPSEDESDIDFHCEKTMFDDILNIDKITKHAIVETEKIETNDENIIMNNSIVTAKGFADSDWSEYSDQSHEAITDDYDNMIEELFIQDVKVDQNLPPKRRTSNKYRTSQIDAINTSTETVVGMSLDQTMVSKTSNSITELIGLEGNSINKSADTTLLENSEVSKFFSNFGHELSCESSDRNEERADEDYDLIAELEDYMEDPEETRNDRTTVVSRKELNRLWNELFQDVDAVLTKKDGAVQSSLAEVNNQLTTDLSVENSKAEKPVYTLNEIEISQLKDQMRKHVQLLTQTYLLSCESQCIYPIKEVARTFIKELDKFSKASLVTESNSLFNPINLHHAMEIIKTDSDRVAIKYHQPKDQSDSNRRKKPISLETMQEMAHCQALIYPELLPTIAFKKQTLDLSKSYFCFLSKVDHKYFDVFKMKTNKLKRFKDSEVSYSSQHDMRAVIAPSRTKFLGCEETLLTLALSYWVKPITCPDDSIGDSKISKDDVIAITGNEITVERMQFIESIVPITHRNKNTDSPSSTISNSNDDAYGNSGKCHWNRYYQAIHDLVMPCKSCRSILGRVEREAKTLLEKFRNIQKNGKVVLDNEFMRAGGPIRIYLLTGRIPNITRYVYNIDSSLLSNPWGMLEREDIRCLCKPYLPKWLIKYYGDFQKVNTLLDDSVKSEIALTSVRNYEDLQFSFTMKEGDKLLTLDVKSNKPETEEFDRTTEKNGPITNFGYGTILGDDSHMSEHSKNASFEKTGRNNVNYVDPRDQENEPSSAIIPGGLNKRQLGLCRSIRLKYKRFRSSRFLNRPDFIESDDNTDHPDQITSDNLSEKTNTAMTRDKNEIGIEESCVIAEVEGHRLANNELPRQLRSRKIEHLITDSIKSSNIPSTKILSSNIRRRFNENSRQSMAKDSTRTTKRNLDFVSCKKGPTSDLDQLFKASSTVGFLPKGLSGVKFRRLNRTRKELEQTLSLLSQENMTHQDTINKRDNEMAIARCFLSQAKKNLSPEVYKVFLDAIISNPNVNDLPSYLELYNKMSTILKDKPDLLSIFAIFIPLETFFREDQNCLPKNTNECDAMYHNLTFDKIRTFLRRLEVYLIKTPNYYRKIIRRLNLWRLSSGTLKELHSILSASCKSNNFLSQSFNKIFYDFPLPLSHFNLEDFEEIDLTSLKKPSLPLKNDQILVAFNPENMDDRDCDTNPQCYDSDPDFETISIVRLPAKTGTKRRIPQSKRPSNRSSNLPYKFNTGVSISKRNADIDCDNNRKEVGSGKTNPADNKMASKAKILKLSSLKSSFGTEKIGGDDDRKIRIYPLQGGVSRPYTQDSSSLAKSSDSSLPKVIKVDLSGLKPSVKRTPKEDAGVKINIYSPRVLNDQKTVNHQFLNLENTNKTRDLSNLPPNPGINPIASNFQMEYSKFKENTMDLEDSYDPFCSNQKSILKFKFAAPYCDYEKLGITQNFNQTKPDHHHIGSHQIHGKKESAADLSLVWTKEMDKFLLLQYKHFRASEIVGKSVQNHTSHTNFYQTLAQAFSREFHVTLKSHQIDDRIKHLADLLANF